jgi:hypothetical protein
MYPHQEIHKTKSRIWNTIVVSRHKLSSLIRRRSYLTMLCFKHISELPIFTPPPKWITIEVTHSGGWQTFYTTLFTSLTTLNQSVERLFGKQLIWTQLMNPLSRPNTEFMTEILQKVGQVTILYKQWQAPPLCLLDYSYKWRKGFL